MKLLFIGNSYTYYNHMPEIFERLSNENGKEVQVYSVTCGGHKLYEYVDYEDEYTEKLGQLMEEHRFDVCVLQEHSTLPIVDYDLFVRGLKDLVEKLKPVTGQFVLYETWGRKEGHEFLAQNQMNNEEMTFQLAGAYEKASEIIGAKISYVGLKFYEIYTKYPEIELYNSDLTHPSYEGSCLAALTHYQTIFGELPGKTETLELRGEVLQVLEKVLRKS